MTPEPRISLPTSLLNAIVANLSEQPFKAVASLLAAVQQQAEPVEPATADGKDGLA